MIKLWQFGLLVLAIIMAIFVGAFLSPSDRQVTKERVASQKQELLSVEIHSEQETRIRRIELWHDKETGEESKCYFTNNLAVSCIKTGRSWK